MLTGCGANIHMQNFSCGHVISESKGGDICIDNLRPVCVKCNSSMGTMNMDEFVKRYGFDKQ